MNTEARQSPDAAIASLTNLAASLLGFAILYAIVLGGIYYRFYAHIADRINQYAPPFIVRNTPLNVISKLWSIGLFILFFVIVAISGRLWQAILLSGMIYAFLIAAILPRVITFFYQRFIRAAYEGGLVKTVDSLRKWPDNIDLLNVKGSQLLQQGQLDEAEAIFRQLLARKFRWGILNVPALLNNLGFCLMHQKRYDEAIEIFIAGLHTNPLFGSTYDSLAGCYLEQNQQPVLAFELSELSIANTPVKLIDALAVQQATAARAQARLGNAEAAEMMLNKAQQALPNIHGPHTAEIHRQIGYAHLALGNPDAARTHFTRAIELDPNGLYGKLAQQGLESISL